MRKVEKLYRLLTEHNGKQVGGKDSNRVEIDLSALLYIIALEEENQRLGEFEMENILLKEYIKNGIQDNKICATSKSRTNSK